MLSVLCAPLMPLLRGRLATLCALARFASTLILSVRRKLTAFLPGLALSWPRSDFRDNHEDNHIWFGDNVIVGQWPRYYLSCALQRAPCPRTPYRFLRAGLRVVCV